MRLLVLALLMFNFLQVISQHTNIRIDNPNLVSYPNEPSVKIDPENPNRVVVGSNLNYFYFSEDGGFNWHSGILESEAYGVHGDPCIVVDNQGHFYYMHLSNPVSGHWIDRIVSQKSVDGGMTWNDGTATGLYGAREQDKEWAVTDRQNNFIYMTWTQFDEYGSSASTDSSIIRFSRSEDGSMTWSPPVRISQKAGDCVDSDNTVEGAVPAVGPEGQVYVAWSGPEGIVFDKSYDHGESWLEQDIFVTEQPTGWDMSIPGISRANGMPVTVCDTSGGQYNGTIYIAFADQRNGENDTDIWLTKSTDEGNSWTTPIRVNDDPPGKHQFFVWMDVDQTNGNLYLVFYDRRNYTDRQTDVFIALSEDGGNSFLNFKISETPFTPTSSVFFGDYTNISVHGGIVRPVWTRLDGITTSLWTAIVDINSLEIQPALTPLSNSSTYPNPFSDQLIMAFELKHATRLNIELFNINGKKLITLAQNKSYGPGQHIENFSYVAPSIPPGIYYISLSGNDFHTIKKIVHN